jgi:hypothetical protein
MKPYPNPAASPPARPAARHAPLAAHAARLARRGLPALAAASLLLAWAPVPAQALRDPTRPPEVTGGPAAPGGAPGARPGPRQLLVVDGRRYVVDGSRLRGVGDMLGAARIEHIEDAAVVVRDAGGTRRLPLHAGVVKRPAPQARPAAPNSR